ncbi:MAG: tetratricopeptide repeat protein [Cyanobacteria bacterium]|nr:tetratricopeptide repeat protein [Cyanobacteriota bacterium]
MRNFLTTGLVKYSVQSLFVGLCLFTLASSPAMSQPLDANRLYNQGVENYAKGNTIQAIELFEKATNTDPKMIDAHFNLGSLYYQTRQYEKAQRSFGKVLSMTPDDTQAKYNLSLCYEKLGQNQEAVRLLQGIPRGDKNFNKAQQRIEELKASLPSTKKTGIATDSTKTDSTGEEPSKKSKWKKDKKSDEVSATPSLKKEDGTKTEPKKTVQTLADGFSGPTGLAQGMDGMLYVANYSKNLIYKVNNAGEKSVFVKEEGLHGPLGLALDNTSGILYVANYLENNILRVSASGKVSVMASGLNKPYNLLLDPQRNILYVTEQGTNSVSKILLNR